MKYILYTATGDLPRDFDACDLVTLLALLQATLVPAAQNSAKRVEKFTTVLWHVLLRTNG